MLRSLHFTSLLILLAIAIARAQQAASFPSESVQQKIHLLKRGESDFGASSIEYLKQEIGSELTDEAVAAFKVKDKGPWKTFTDEVISFEYPDHPQLRVVPIEPDEEVAIIGGAVGTTDRSFQRAYRFLVGTRIPYLTIFVQETGEFDDGICMCGPITHEQLLIADGTLLRFSYLPGGAVKKVQALGAKHRAILLEWTHTAISQEAFARIGCSIRFKEASTRTRDQWIDELKKQSETEDRFAWLQARMENATVRELLGEPASADKDRWTYTTTDLISDGSVWQRTARLPFKDGKLALLPPDWLEVKELDPAPSSLRWIEKLTERGSEKAPGVDQLEEDQGAPGISAEQARLAADAFLERKETGARYDRSRWHRAMAELFEMKRGDPRVVAAVEEQFLALDQDQEPAVELLHAAESKRLEELALERARRLVQNAHERVGELKHLLQQAGTESKAAREIYQSAREHLLPSVRAAAVQAADAVLDDSAAKAAHFAALLDKDPIVRRAAADPMAWITRLEKAELPQLKRRFAEEADPATRNSLASVIQSLER